MKPRLAKPSSIIAQVEGSGTAPPKTKMPGSSSVTSTGPEKKPKLMTRLSSTSPRIRSPRKLKSNVTLALSRDSWLGQRIEGALAVEIDDGVMDGLVECGDI